MRLALRLIHLLGCAMLTAALVGCGPGAAPEPEAHHSESNDIDAQIAHARRAQLLHFDHRMTQFRAENERLDASATHLVFFGDSLTEGFAELPSAGDGRVSLNRGIAGDPIRPGMYADPSVGLMNRFPESFPPVPIAGVHLLIGTNDVLDPGYDVETLKANYRDLFDAIEERLPGVPVIVSSVPPFAPAHPHYEGVNARIAEVNAWLEPEATGRGHGWVDLNAALAGDDGAMRPEFATEDGVHFTPLTYQTWTALLLPAMEAAGMVAHNDTDGAGR